MHRFISNMLFLLTILCVDNKTRNKIMSEKPLYPSIIQELLHQKELLQQEYEYEKAEFCKQTESAGLIRKIHKGICWFPLQIGRSYYNSLNQFVVEIYRTDKTEINHAFEFGRPIRFFQQHFDGRIVFFNFTAIVSYAEENRLVAILPQVAHLAELENKDNLGVQLFFDETSYKAMFEALADVIQAKNNRLSQLRDIILSKQSPIDREIYPIRFPWLNQSQENAVNKVLCAKDVAVVHGPPGTGKTTTMVEAIYETLHRETQVLVCAQSNTAVDWIAEKLVDRGVPVLRIGNPTKVNDKMLSFTYERQFENHSLYAELWSIRKSIRECTGSLRKKSHSEKEKIRNRLVHLRERSVELEIRINEDLFANARVVASTLIGSNHRVLTGRYFSTLFIDEAAQALEAACWVAIRKANRVILAGDHCQLPPTIKCVTAARQGLSHTLMEKICLRNPSVVTLLNIQYRMHRDIMRFSSRWFYNGELQAASEVSDRGILDMDYPIMWIDTSDLEFHEDFISETAGRINKNEAGLLLQELQQYISKIGYERIMDEKIDIGIISPYKAQVQYIRSLLKKNTFFKPYRSIITVNTVDGFQGQEKDIIFISLVRANEHGNIGFLNDLRRMNVAITRARMKLIILGDTHTLNKHTFYRKLMEYIDSLKSN